MLKQINDKYLLIGIIFCLFSMFAIARITRPYGYGSWAVPPGYPVQYYEILPFGIGALIGYIIFMITIGLILVLIISTLVRLFKLIKHKK